MHDSVSVQILMSCRRREGGGAVFWVYLLLPHMQVNVGLKTAKRCAKYMLPVSHLKPKKPTNSSKQAILSACLRLEFGLSVCLRLLSSEPWRPWAATGISHTQHLIMSFCLSIYTCVLAICSLWTVVFVLYGSIAYQTYKKSKQKFIPNPLSDYLFFI